MAKFNWSPFLQIQIDSGQPKRIIKGKVLKTTSKEINLLSCIFDNVRSIKRHHGLAMSPCVPRMAPLLKTSPWHLI